MIVENSYPRDPRVRNEVTSLQKAGHRVFIIALNKRKEPAVEEVNRALVFRIPVVKQGRKPRFSAFAGILRLLSRFDYAIHYFYFTSVSFLLSLYIFFRYGFDGVHIHNPADILFLIGAFYRLFGKIFIFDQHEHMPELYLSRYNVSDGWMYKALLKIEKFTLRSANLVITTNESYKRLNMERAGIDPEKVTVVRNGPDLARIQAVLSQSPKWKPSCGKKLCFVGVINPQDGVEYFVRAIKHLVYDFGRNDCVSFIIGRGDSLDSLKFLAKKYGITDYVVFPGFLEEEEVYRHLDSCEICVEPAPDDPFNRISTPIKVMEYMALKKPVVCFDLPEIRYTAGKAAVYVPPNDVHAFARAICELLDDPEKRTAMGRYGYERIQNLFAWRHMEKNLLHAYDMLFLNENSRLRP